MRSKRIRRQRLIDLLEVHGIDASKIKDEQQLQKFLVSFLGDSINSSKLWQLLYSSNANMPNDSEFDDAVSLIYLQGTENFVSRILEENLRSPAIKAVFLKDKVLIDSLHTSKTALATGIQRVAREVMFSWKSKKSLEIITWNEELYCFRRVNSLERQRATGVSEIDKPITSESIPKEIIIPVSGQYILPELAAEDWRTSRLRALSKHSGLVTGIIGFDCVPITSAETVAPGMAAAFSRNLTAVAEMNKVAAISTAAELEYLGWRTMLAAKGKKGPEIKAIPLANSVPYANKEEILKFQQRYNPTNLPIVLVVGSHEPRKNHLAILRASENLWKKGQEFKLIFIGGNSWNNNTFSSRVYELRNESYEIELISAVTDTVLFAAYSSARFTLFPSINEGFGLPVAESLSAGIPSITSNFGSMKAIAEGYGGLLINPRDDESIESAMHTLLASEIELDKLQREARGFKPVSWDNYAQELWDYFTS